MASEHSDISGDVIPREDTPVTEDMEERSQEEELMNDSREDEKEERKVCGVCGDMAKCYHFGGLCCDSCKSFFRRSIQSESWETFLCVHGGGCEIRQNRRACQACRFEMCKKIGMDPSLVMNAEDRRALLLRKLEKRKQLLQKNRRLKEQQQTTSYQQENENEKEEESSMDCDDDKPANTENVTEMDSHTEESKPEWFPAETFSEKNHEKIKGLQKMLRKALTFPEFPRHYYEGGTDVIEHLFFVFCKSMGKYFSFVPEFQELDRKDQGVLLKDAVAKSIFIFGAHQFQEDQECWPRRLLSPYCTFPTIILADTENFIGDSNIFFMMKTFMRKFCRFFDDEVVTILSLMISVFDTDSPLVSDTSRVTGYKESYTQLLVNYLQYQNASVSVAFFMTELQDCFSEVKELKESFQRENSKEDAKPFRGKEEGSFASSLHDLGEDPKMAPKKAFFERTKVKKCHQSSEVLTRDDEYGEQQENANISFSANQSDNELSIKEEVEEVMMVSEPSPCFKVTEDHNYQKPDIANKFQPPEEEVEILATYGLEGKTSPEDRHCISSSLKLCQRQKVVISKRIAAANIPSSYIEQDDHWMTDGTDPPRQLPPAFAIPVSTTKNRSFSNPRGFERHQDLYAYSGEINVGSSVDCSGQLGFDIAHQSNIHGLSFYSPVPSRTSVSAGNSARFMHGPRELECLSSEERPLFHQRPAPALALKTVPMHLPVNTPVEICSPTRSHRCPCTGQVNIHSEVCLNQRPYSQVPEQSSSGLPSRALQGQQLSRHVPRQSPMSHMCLNMSQMSTDDDKQLVEVAQSVLPPHLMKHLITRLGTGQREQL